MVNDPVPLPKVDLAYTHDHPNKTEKVPQMFKRKSNIFTDKWFFLGTDLDIHTKLANTLEDIIKDGGGNIATQLQDANVLLCHWRDGDGAATHYG